MADTQFSELERIGNKVAVALMGVHRRRGIGGTAIQVSGADLLVIRQAFLEMDGWGKNTGLSEAALCNLISSCANAYTQADSPKLPKPAQKVELPKK
jgi:F420-0:gamma-glutamyl ligase